MRLAASLWKTARGHRQGGSTLTMQLARNFFPDIGRAPALQRKLYEIVTALKIERSYLKHEILEMYLNTVPFGYHAFGIETAAQTYFNKSAAALNVIESATLVGMLKGITLYNPVRNPERATKRRNVVLGQMVQYGSLDAAVFDSLRRAPLGLDFQFNTAATGPAPHFTETMRTWLADWAAGQGYDLYTSGLRVYRSIRACRRWPRRRSRRSYAGCKPSLGTNGAAVGPPISAIRRTSTRARAAGRFEPFAYFRRARRHLIDPHIRRSPRYRKALRQGAAPDEALETLHADAAFIDSLCSNLTRLEVGLVALDPTTGHVLAWVGGRDFARDQYDKVALARRQPGSTFKPFVYAAALELGYSPDDQRVDIVRTYQTSGPDKTWTPTNADGEASGDTLTLPADSLRLLAASDTIPPAWRLGDVEGVLRRAVSRSLLADTARIALANTAHADTTRRVPFLTPLDTTRRHPVASPRSRSDTDLEQTMRRLLFPDEPAEKDSSDTRNSATWRDQE